MIDLTILPLSFDAGIEQVELPGLYAAFASRRAARLRAQDTLVLYLTLTGNAPLSGNHLQELLQKLSGIYFNSAGSVTAGLRSMVDVLNEYLYDRNQKLARDGQQGVGLLNSLVLHGETLFVAHSGLTHTFILDKDKFEIINDAPGQIRGLGLSTTFIPQYFKFPLTQNEFFILSAEPSPVWREEYLVENRGLALDQLRRKLLVQVPLNLQAAVLKLQPGSGQVRWLRPRQNAARSGRENTRTIQAPNTATGATPSTLPPELAAALSEPLEEPTPIETTPAETLPLSSETIAQIAEEISVTIPSTGVRVETSLETTPAPHATAQAELATVLPDTITPETQDGTEPQPLSSPEMEEALAIKAEDQGPLPKAPQSGETSAPEMAVNANPSEAPLTESAPAQPETELPSPGHYLGVRSSTPPADAEPPDLPTRISASGSSPSHRLRVARKGAVENAVDIREDTGETGESSKAVKPASKFLTAAASVIPPVRLPDLNPIKASVSAQANRLGSLLLGWFKTLITAIEGFFNHIGRSLQNLLARVLPTEVDLSFGLSPAVSLFIVIAIPVIVVAVTSTFFLRSGRGEQHQIYLVQAGQYATEGEAQSDLLRKRSNFELAVSLLNKAEEMGVTPESSRLRQTIEKNLDGMDKVVRLPFRQALLSPIDSTLHITRIVSALNGGEVYILDGKGGRVYRLVRIGQYYEVDVNFHKGCGPTKIGSLNVGPLVSFDLIPSDYTTKNQYKVMAVDAAGVMLLCGMTSVKEASALPSLSTGWGKVMGFKWDNYPPYLIDSRSLWRFKPSYDDKDRTLAFTTAPRAFFEENPPDMEKIRDFGIGESNDVYFLRSNGTLIICTPRVESEREGKVYILKPLMCLDNEKFGDFRSGREANPSRYPEANFTQLLLTPQPEPALYLMDDLGVSLYQFSYRLAFNQIFKPQTGIDSPIPRQAPSAFTVTANRNVIMAFGHVLVQATLP